LKELFDGTNPDYKEITFFGVTNLSIEQFLVKTINDDWEPVYNRVKDIPADLCREMLLSHIVAGKMMKTEFDYEVKGTLAGGTVVKTLSGGRTTCLLDEIGIRRYSRHRGGRIKNTCSR